MTNAAGDTVQIDASGKLTLNAATITGGKVLDNGTLALIGSAVIQNGALTNNNVFTVAERRQCLSGTMSRSPTTRRWRSLAGGALTVDLGTVADQRRRSDTVQIDVPPARLTI